MIECGNLAAPTLCHPKMQIQDQQRQLSISQWCCAHHLRAAFCAHALWTGVQQQAQAQVHKRVSTSTPVYKTLARAKKSPVRPNWPSSTFCLCSLNWAHHITDGNFWGFWAAFCTVGAHQSSPPSQSCVYHYELYNDSNWDIIWPRSFLKQELSEAFTPLYISPFEEEKSIKGCDLQ